MGGIWFDPETLGDGLSETAGYKSGLALSIEEMCDHLADTRYADLLRDSETQTVRIRSEDYDELFYKLLHRIGYTKEEYSGYIAATARLLHKCRGTNLEPIHEGILELFIEIWPKLISQSLADGTKLVDPTPFITSAFERYGKRGAELAIERIRVVDEGMRLRPDSGLRYTEWKGVKELKSLFGGDVAKPEVGKFIDQRYLNYLIANQNRLADMHWRKFEELTAEYFHRQDFSVELGPGVNDDGVDIRVWKNFQNVKIDPPHILIQCKRQKAKVEKVVVKGLYADMQYFDAKYGLIVTSSELSPGARETILARGYPINEVDNIALRNWLKA